MTVRFPRVADLALIVFFLAAIALPAAGLVIGVGVADGSDENRVLAPRPELRWNRASLAALPEAFTRYFEDRFALRSLLVRLQAQARWHWLHASPTSAVVRGRDGWLFYGEDGALEDAAGNQPFSEAELTRWASTLQHTHDALAARGIRFLFVLAPDKHHVYPEYLPETLTRLGESRADQLTRYVAANTTVTIVDLRSSLRAAKVAERVYHRTDTHWNDRGAFVGYTTIMNSLAGENPALRPTSSDAFDRHERRARGLDLAGMLGLSGVLTEQDLRLVPKTPRRARVVEPRHPAPYGEDAIIVTETPAVALPRAVVFRDSFASALIPFLSEHFSRAVYMWQHNVDPATLAAEQPDVVVQEWVTRRLYTQVPYDPFGEIVAR